MPKKSDTVTRDTAATPFASLWHPSEVLKRDGIARNNAISVFLMGALPAMGGSAISVLLVVFFVWGVISLAFRRFPPLLTRTDRIIAWIFTIFVGSVLITALIGGNLGQLWRHTVWLLPFLAAWIVVPRMRASREIDYLIIYVAGAAIGAISAGLYVLAFWSLGDWFVGSRPVGGAGNVLVFAQMCLLLGTIASLNITSANRKLQWLALWGLLFGFVAAIFTVSRGVWLVAIPLVFLTSLYALPVWRWILSKPLVWITTAMVVSIAAYGSARQLDRRMDRLLEFVQDIWHVGGGNGQQEPRIRLWEAAWSAIAESPIWGYGIQNRMHALFAHYPNPEAIFGGYSHAHNGYLSALLDGGLIVLAATIALLAAPILIAWRAPRDKNHRLRLFLALILSSVYATVGLSNIMLGHDIIDAFFIFTVIVIAASTPRDCANAVTGQDGKQRPQRPVDNRLGPHLDSDPANATTIGSGLDR